MPRPSRWPEVVEAAAEEFRVSGYERATLEAIATRVGMLKGSLYNSIENKDDRYLSAIEAIIADGVARGEFSSGVRVPVAARAVVGMLDWMQHWFVPREGDRPEDIADELFTLTFSGLNGRVGAAPTTEVTQDGAV